MSRIKIVQPPANGGKLKPNYDYTALAHEADATIKQLTQQHKRTSQMYQLLMSDRATDAHWNMANYTTVSKLNYNDHGPIHARVTASYAMQIMTLLLEAGVPFDVIQSGAGELDDAFLVVLSGIMLHDIGNALHRINHEAMSVVLAQRVLERLLPKIYEDFEQQTLISDFILAAIESHDMNPPPLLMEGAVVAVADGCDMTKGRARVPFDMGKIDIHAVSALSIEDVNIHKGSSVPVEIEVQMSNSAGIFQVEQTLVAKLVKTPLLKYATVTARTIDPSGFDARIIQKVGLKDGRLQMTQP